MAATQENVLRLDVAVHDPLVVRVREGIGDLAGDPEGVLERKLLFAVDSRPQRFTLHVRHHIVEHPCRFARIEQREYVGMVQSGGEGDLAKKALGAERPSQLRLEHLEGDGTIVLQIMGAIYRGHSAPADFVTHAIALSQRAP